MAVMASLPTNGVALEQKTQPVPSSDKMALDLDINGTSNHDDTIHDSAPTEEPLDVSANHVSDDSAPVNGSLSTNVDAVKSNALLDAPNQIPEPSPTDANRDSAIEEAIDELQTDVPSPLPPSSVPPVVEAEESDLREEPKPENIQPLEPVAVAVDVSEAKEDEVDMLVSPAVPEVAPVESAAAVAAAPAETQSTDAPSQAEPTQLEATQSDPQPSSNQEPLHPQSVATLNLNSSSQPDAPPALNLDTQDTPMTDAPLSPSKMTREREEDAEDQPIAKRAKTESLDDEPEDEPLAKRVKTEARDETAPSSNGVPQPASQRQKMAPNQFRELLKATRGQKQSKAGVHFKAPVVELYPVLAESYLAKVSHPVDLSMVESKLKNSTYEYVDEFTADLNQMVENCYLFNGAEHEISKAAASVRDILVSKIPEPVYHEPAKPEKKKRSTPSTEGAPRGTPVRRQSKTVNPPPAPPVSTPAAAPAAGTAAQSAQTFALAPSGTPVIRRDSTKGDGGRPKREIHPPKPKDLPYASKPKKKKFATELKFCEEVLENLRKPRNASFNWPFLTPVDPVALNIPTYFKIVKTPMDLSTIGEKLQAGQYEQAKDFEADIRLMVNNCHKFNPPENMVHVAGTELEQYFDIEWSKKDRWVADHTPASAATSPISAEPASDDESSEDEEEEEVVEAPLQSLASQRLIEEQQKLIELMTAKKPDQNMIRMQQDLVAIVKKQVDAELAALKKPSKKKSSKPKPAPSKKKQPETKKKSGTGKTRFIGTTEKEIISVGIQQLDEAQIEIAFELIRADMPHLAFDGGEVELDIDAVSQPTLNKLYDIVIKHVPSLAPSKPAPAARPPPSATTKPKKNKPMGKAEQEQKIERLKKLQQQFDQKGGPRAVSSGVVPSVEQDESSGDEESSDSEED